MSVYLDYNASGLIRPEVLEVMTGILAEGGNASAVHALGRKAPVGGVAAAEQTYRHTERVFDYERLEPVVVKGKAEPVAIWRPVRARARFGTDVTR